MRKNVSKQNVVSKEITMPSENLVTSFLKRTQNNEKGQKFINDQWARIQLCEPNLARLINVNAYRLAPDEPEVREMIAISMVQMYLIFSEAALQEELLDNLGPALEDYFAQGSRI